MKKQRITWPAVAGHVREWVETSLGSPVVSWASQSGGWSPGTADRLRCADGTRAFLKAVHPGLNEQTPQLLRDEIRVARLLGPEVPCAHLIASFDDGAWVAILLEDIEGRHPRAPWREDELGAVLEALDELAGATTPVRADGLLSVQEAFLDDFSLFDGMTRDVVASAGPWAVENRHRLIDLARVGVAALDGESLGHGDLRADNIIVEPSGRVRLVDWPNATKVAPWVDGVGLGPNVENLGGLVAADGGSKIDVCKVLIDWAGRYGATREQVIGVWAGFAAYYTASAARPPVPGLPTLRRDQGIARDATIRLVRRALGS